MGIRPQARAQSAENQSYDIMTAGIQQLQREGFGPGQIRALAEFTQGLIDKTVQPIVERIDRRFGQVDQRLEQIDQRFVSVDRRFVRIDQQFKQIDQQFEKVNQQFKQIDRQFNHANQQVDRQFQQVDRQFVQIDQRFAMISGQLESLQEGVLRLQRWPWMPYLVMGLAFAGLYIALFGIWLAMVWKAA